MTERAERGPDADPGAPSAQDRAGRIPAPSPWTPERVAELCRLRAKGFSAREIAKQLSEGMPDGRTLTKNQVIGKMNREGLTGSEVVEAPRQLDLFPPLGTCVFAKGDRETGFDFCGKPLAHGSMSWCLEHREVCGGRIGSRVTRALRLGVRGSMLNHEFDEW